MRQYRRDVESILKWPRSAPPVDVMARRWQRQITRDRPKVIFPVFKLCGEGAYPKTFLL